MEQRAERATRFDFVMTVLGSLCFLVAVATIVFASLQYYDVVDANPIPETIGVIARIPAALFLIAGVTGIHSSHRSAAGALGRVAFVVIVLGLVLFAVVLPFWQIGWLVLHVGVVLLGIAALRAGVLSQLGARVLAVGVPVAFLGGIVLESAFGGEMGWGPHIASVLIAVGLVLLGAPRRASV